MSDINYVQVGQSYFFDLKGIISFLEVMKQFRDNPKQLHTDDWSIEELIERLKETEKQGYRLSKQRHKITELRDYIAEVDTNHGEIISQLKKRIDALEKDMAILREGFINYSKEGV